MAADQGRFHYQFPAVTRSTLTFMFEHLTTESRNPASEDLDSLSTGEIVRLINAEDAKVAAAVEQQADAIARAVDAIADRLAKGGRLIYIGAGTSGRLGVLDAVECPPTFNTNPARVVGVIAGGYSALTRAVEGAEDLPAMAIDDLKNLNVTAADVVVGIATSGRTPYVMGALDYARSTGAFTVGLSCNRDPELATRCDVSIAPVVGPEVVSGSTRMKAGTATKMVCNMITTGAMIRIGKSFGNLMVDLKATNAKLADRAERIVMEVCTLSRDDARALLRAAHGEVKLAIVMHATQSGDLDARERLAQANGVIRLATAHEPPPFAGAPGSTSTSTSMPTSS